MTRRRHCLAILLALWPLALPAAAPDLYAARVPVAGGALDAAFAAALGEVYVKVSGERAAAGTSTREAGQLVRRYQPQAGGFVRVEFDPPAVRARLDAAGHPVWVAPRPDILVVGGGEPSPDGNDPLAVAATARGLVARRAPAGAVPAPAAGDAEVLARAAAAGAGAVLYGRPEPTLGGAVLRWTLVGPEEGNRSDWTGDLAAGIDGAADRLARRYAAPPGTVVDLAMRVAGLADFAAYLGLGRWLAEQPGVEAVDVAGVSAGGFRYRLRVRGGAAQLQALVATPGAPLVPLPPDGGEPAFRLGRQP
jgi:hypothetical protein